MSILFWVSLAAIIIFFCLYKLTKKLVKAAIILFFIYLIAFITIAYIMVADARSLSKLEDTESLFILEEQEKAMIAVGINFSSTKQTIFSDEQIQEIKYKSKEDQKELLKEYFKIMVIKKEALEETLEQEIIIPDVVTIPKEELLKGLEDEDAEQRASFFIIAIAEILNFADEESMKQFIRQSKKGNIMTYPPIKVITILSLLPEDMIENLKFPLIKQEENPKN